jgi:hypothetical protein
LGLIKDLFHIIEILFLAFMILVTVKSLSLGIIFFVILLGVSFFFHNLSKAIAWAVVIFLLVINAYPGDVIFGLIMALIFGGVRYLLGHGFKFAKK